MRQTMIAVCVLALTSAPLRADDAFFFKKGDRIVFLGDSITEQYQYSTYIELYLTTRFPDWNLTFVNAGISGDTASGGANRFKAHILDEKPTCVTINFGMNDGGYGQFDEGRNATYRKNTAAMLDAAKAAGVRVALISPNAVDRRIQERFKLYVETQKQFYAPLKEIAEKGGAVFVDQYATTRSALEKMEQDDPKAAKAKPFGDGFHTSPPGGLLMAHAILTGLKAPAKVSNVQIIVSKTEANADGCTVANLKVAPTAVSFDRTDNAIPMPVQKDWLAMLPYTNELKDLNYYGLTVSGLADGKYELSIDGKKAGTFTSKELDAGVNLGNLTEGAVFEHGQKVLQAINAKNNLVHQRFRGVVMYNPAPFPEWAGDLGKQFAVRKAEELSKRWEAINAKQAEIYQAVAPAKHSFKLEQVKGE